MDIVVWLRSLGLGKYEAIFRENDIDETVLASLTHENLKELGVASFGHRVKLLDAIAALRNASGKAPSVDAATTSSAPSAHPEDRAERRQVTVMFSDLWAQRPCRRGWTLKTFARLFRPIKSALRKPWGVLAASLRSTWARGAHLLRLSAGTRGRRRASRARWAGAGGGCRPTEDPLTTTNAG